MKILVYATTLGADLWAFTHYMDQMDDVDLRVLVKNKERFLSEGIANLYPLKAPLTERKWYHSLKGIPGFKPDVTIMDNEIPLWKFSPNGLVLWHGFGWKGPNDEEEFKWIHRLLRWSWGNTKKPNKNFTWQCFGEWDCKHRTEVSGFHPGNCESLGAASHDYLKKPIDKSIAQPYYDFNIVENKTVLIAPTWHYGEVFSHWEGDHEVLPILIQQITSRGDNVLLRLHDSFRFDDSYIAFLRTLAADNPRVMLKFKNHHPDNLLDLQISDVLITNFSSIANLFYATGKPTIHVYPVKDEDQEFMWRTYHLTGTRERKVDSVKYIWKLPPEENGGVIANNSEELYRHLENALQNPDYCKKQALHFVDKYMLGADGQNCLRILKQIEKMTGKKVKDVPEFVNDGQLQSQV